VERLPNFTELFDAMLKNTLEVSLPAYAAELVICATVVVMLLLRVPRFTRVIPSAAIAFIGTAIALWLAAPWHYLDGALPRDPAMGSSLFTGMLVYDEFSVFFRSLLFLFVLLFIIFTQISGIPDREDAADVFTLVLGATLGMCLMVSTNHLVIAFLGVEMASVPSYALAGILKGRRESSEAALKYAVFGAGAAGVMLYGISLVAGVLGSLHMPTIAIRLSAMFTDGSLGASQEMVLVLAGLMIAVGLAFKLSAVPFHFWCPDVFEGASAEVNAFLSVASKAAALALLVRICVGFGHVPEPSHPTAQATAAVQTAADKPVTDAAASPATPLPSAASQALEPSRHYIQTLVGFLAAITCTFGNLAAYGQTNIKRLLAYSTIAHAGYLMMPVAAAMALAGTRPHAAEQAVASLGFYVGAYLFMNLGAFAVVAFFRNALRSEEIADYAGLIRRFPVLVICFAAILLSLIGLPPFAGFAAKFNIFAALAQAKLWFLLAVGGINSVISLFYYLRVVKVMTLDPEPENRVPFSYAHMGLAGIYASVITVPIVVLGLWWNGLNVWAQAAAAHLFT
jgi:NADH-quinone oxidoreductase subunit N